MKRTMLLIAGAIAILIGIVTVQELTAKKSIYYPSVPLKTPTATVAIASSPPATPVATVAPAYHPAVTSAPVVTKAPVVTPAPTADPRCSPYYSTAYINDLLAGMKATGYTPAQIDDVRAQAYMVQGWQSVHCF